MVETINPKLCPLCAQDNACKNVSCDDTSKLTCWCQNPEIKFPPQLLQQVPEKAKNKACICQSCAMEFVV